MAPIDAFAAVLQIRDGSLPDPVNGFSQTATQNVLLALVVLCLLAIVFVIRTIQKAVLRMVVVAILVMVGAGLFYQRVQVQDCVIGETCRVFGQDIDISGNP